MESWWLLVVVAWLVVALGLVLPAWRDYRGQVLRKPDRRDERET